MDSLSLLAGTIDKMREPFQMRSDERGCYNIGRLELRDVSKIPEGFEIETGCSDGFVVVEFDDFAGTSAEHFDDVYEAVEYMLSRHIGIIVGNFHLQSIDEEYSGMEEPINA